MYLESEKSFDDFLKEFENSSFAFMYDRSKKFCKELKFILDNWEFKKGVFE